VNATFYRIAADLAGVALTKPDLEVAQKVVRAELINHDQNDPNLPSAEDNMKKKKKKCNIF